MKGILFSLLLTLLTGMLTAQTIPYTNCDNCWDAHSLGNHRVAVEFIGTGQYAKSTIPWRRRDLHPENIRVIVQDGQTGKKIENIKTGTITREYGEVFFEPTSGKGIYYIYYMPFKNTGSANYPNSVYLLPEKTASEEWLQGLEDSNVRSNTAVNEFQSINSFNTFYPMEVVATEFEANRILKENPSDPFLVFPEDRLYSIRMREDLPQRWIEKGLLESFVGEADRGENFAFQLGIYARENIKNIQLQFSDLENNDGKKIKAQQFSCLNTDGIGYDALPIKKQLDISKGKIQPMWCLLDVPEDAEPGSYHGTVTVKTEGSNFEKRINLSLHISGNTAIRHGADKPENLTRLQWLNSTLAQANTVIAPYTPLIVSDRTISLLGRKFEVNADGLPRRIQTFFTPEMTSTGSTANEIIAAPLRLIAEDSFGVIKWKNDSFRFLVREPGTVSWEAESSSPLLKMKVHASLEFDGFVNYSVKITALQNVNLNDIRLEIPFTHLAAKYMMGLGRKGGFRPDDLDWKWDVAHKNQDGSWIGNVNAGLQFSLRDEKYVRPLNTNFYLQKPLLLPTSWGNDGKGGIRITTNKKDVIVNNYSGARRMEQGDSLFYNFTLLITPFHPLNTDFQWQTRFYHAYKPIDTVKASGATVINIHHANAINPWINYPFIEWQKMKDYIDSAHAVGLKVKIYNTVRELSNHAYETFALRSLGHEIYSPGKGGGYSWLQEHIGQDYIAAWFVPKLKDAAIINSGMNRWHNYYVEGMNWLTQNVGIDGIYLDDVAFDRITMKRIKRVLTQSGHPGIIDLHSANQYNERDGFNNSANLYMEHFPYLNRLWFGEYFDYENNGPDFFLTEVSGIPFGLMGEMLQNGGNPYRGMIYGMTNRMPWSDNADPRPIWKAWDDFGMEGSKMIGYWVDGNPVKITNANGVLATVYKKKGKAMVSLASWQEHDTELELKIDWKKLGLDPAKVSIKAPEIKNLQPARQFRIHERIPVEKAKGWLLIIEEK